MIYSRHHVGRLHAVWPRGASYGYGELRCHESEYLWTLTTCAQLLQAVMLYSLTGNQIE